MKQKKCQEENINETEKEMQLRKARGCRSAIVDEISGDAEEVPLKEVAKKNHSLRNKRDANIR